MTDVNITSLSGTKLTGGVQLSAVAGSSCSSAGLLRYDAGNVQVCDGAGWTAITSSGGGVIAAATGNPAAAANGAPIIFPTKYVDTSAGNNFYNATTGRFTIPSSGEYKLHMVTNGAPGGALTFYIYVNNILQLEVGSMSTSTISANLSGVRFYNTGDIVDVRANSSYDSIGGNIFMEKVGGAGAVTSAGIISALGYTPQNASKISLNCTASQTVQYISVSDSYQCQSILVSDSNISSLAGSKLTGGVQVGTVSGTTCTSAGLTRYNSSNLEFCDGSSWKIVSAYSSSSVPVVSDWNSYNPTFTAFGSQSNVDFRWRRIGDSMFIKGTFASGASTGTVARISLPSGFQIDTSKVFGTPRSRLGDFTRSRTGGAEALPSVTNGPFMIVEDTTLSTTEVFFSFQVATSANNFALALANSFVNSGEVLDINFIVPIAGWSSNINLTAPNPIVVIATNASGQLISPNTMTILTNWTELKDPSNSFNATAGIFTAPEAGDYEVTSLITFGDTSATGDRVINIRNLTTSDHVAENIRPYTSAGSGQIGQNVSTIVSLTAGQQVAITATHGAAVGQNIVGVARRNTLTIKKVGY